MRRFSSVVVVITLVSGCGPASLTSTVASNDAGSSVDSAAIDSGVDATVAPVPTSRFDRWTTAFVTEGASQSLYPDIAIDTSDVTHIVYERTQTAAIDDNRHIEYLNDRSGAFSNALTVSPTGVTAQLPRMASRLVGEQTHIVIAFKGKTGGDNATSRIYIARSVDGGASFSEAKAVSNEPSFEPAVAIDADGVIHVAFCAQIDADHYRIHYVSYDGAVATDAIDIGTPMAGAYQNQPAISAFSTAAGRTLLVLFMGVTGGQAEKTVYSTRRVNGGAFSVPEVRYHGSAEYPDLATSATGTVAATWHGWTQEFNYEPYFSVSRDGGSTWTVPEPRGPRDPSLGTRPAVARNSTGVIALFWDDDYRAPPINKSDILARVSLDDGASWSDIFEIFRGVDFSREVEAAAGNRLFRAVWHDGASGTFQIGLATAR